jgi:predicted nucleic acid-binding protein
LRLYLDSVTIIYLVEEVSAYLERINFILNTGSEFCTSQLSFLECKIKPTRENHLALLADYEYFFNESMNIYCPINIEVLEIALKIRTNYNFKTPDSIHLATAIYCKCDSFVKNDKRFGSFQELKIITLDS